MKYRLQMHYVVNVNIYMIGLDDKKNRLLQILASIYMTRTNYVKKDSKDFHYNDIAQIISEICGISRRQMFNIKKPLKLQGLQKVGIKAFGSLVHQINSFKRFLNSNKVSKKIK